MHLSGNLKSWQCFYRENETVFTFLSVRTGANVSVVPLQVSFGQEMIILYVQRVLVVPKGITIQER